MRRFRRLAASLAAGAVCALGGCGGEQSGEQEGTIPPATVPAAPTASPIASVAPQPATATRRRARPRRRARATRLFSAADQASFRALEAQLGAVGLVAGPLGRSGGAESLGSLESGSAWSTIKLPISLRILQDGLKGNDDAQIRRALTASDNVAAAALWTRLSARHGGAAGAAEAVGEVLAQGGDGSTQVSTQGRGSFSPYGQTEWSLRAAQRFMAGVAGGCTEDADATGEILALMGEVIPGQSWGLGSAGRPARFKGGWGPGADGTYLVRQVGVIEYDAGQRAVAVALAARPGSFAAGTAALTSLARWAAQHIDARAVRPGRC